MTKALVSAVPGTESGSMWLVRAGVVGVRTVSRREPRRVRVRGDLFHGEVPEGAVYVGRGAPGLPASRYANPHRIGRCRRCGTVHDRAAAVAAYEQHLAGEPALLDQARRELRGRDLACWCRLDLACHADVLLRMVNAGGRAGEVGQLTFGD